MKRRKSAQRHRLHGGPFMDYRNFCDDPLRHVARSSHGTHMATACVSIECHGKVSFGDRWPWCDGSVTRHAPPIACHMFHAAHRSIPDSPPTRGVGLIACASITYPCQRAHAFHEHLLWHEAFVPTAVHISFHRLNLPKHSRIATTVYSTPPRSRKPKTQASTSAPVHCKWKAPQLLQRPSCPEPRHTCLYMFKV